MKQNPELMKQFDNAAINQMGDDKKSAANFFSGFAPGMESASQQQFGDRPMPMRPSSNFMAPGQTPVGAQPRQTPVSSRPMPQYTEGPEPMMSQSGLINEGTSQNVSSRSTSKFNNGTKKIPAPVGVEDILNELSSNTDDISEIVSRSKRGDDNRNINLVSQKQRPKRSINLNL